MKKYGAIIGLCFLLMLCFCACAEIPPASSEPSSASSELPPVSSESAEPNTSPDPIPTEAVSPTPAPTATPIPTKKPTATPTAKLTIAARPQGGTPEYLSSYPFGSIDELRKFVLTADERTFQKGHYASMLNVVRSEGYIFAPIFTQETVFETVTGKTIALAISEQSFEAPGVGYRAKYKNTDALICIYNLSAENSAMAKNSLFAYERGKSTQTSSSAANAKQVKETSIKINGDSRKTCGRVLGDRYRIWYLLDDTHLVQVEWFTNDAAAAEEFVSKLEFAKVELEPVTAAPKTTPEAEKVTP